MTVDRTTGEIVERPTFGEVRESVDRAKEHGVPFFEAILWQIENEVWTVLGYASWDVMRDAEYAEMGVVVPRADRPEITSRLRKRGLTQQQIASTLGVSVGTINNDLKFSSENEPSATSIATARGQERPASYAPRLTTPAPIEEGEAEMGAGQPQAPDGSASERALGEYVSDQREVMDSKYALEFFRALNAATGVTEFDAYRLGRLIGDDGIDAVAGFSDSLSKWVERAKSSRTQLRVIGGGKR